MTRLSGGRRPLGGGDGDVGRLRRGGVREPVRDGPHDACIAASFLDLRFDTTCWSAAAVMSRRRAERSRDVREQRKQRDEVFVPLKQCDVFFF
jgi:hypothetical protein